MEACRELAEQLRRMQAYVKLIGCAKLPFLLDLV
jgi:hypothetical protein